MRDKFHLNACVKLKPQKDNQLNFCEVAAEVDTNFIVDLKSFYSRIVTVCVGEMHTVRLSLISIKLMPIGDKIKIIANVILSKDEVAAGENIEDFYHKINITLDNDQLGIHRLFKYMEVLSMKQLGGKFLALVHVRVVPVEADDLPVTKF